VTSRTSPNPHHPQRRSGRVGTGAGPKGGAEHVETRDTAPSDARESSRLSRSADEGPASPYLLQAHCTCIPSVRLGEPVISPQNLSPAFAPRPIARANVLISSNSLSCPLRPYRRSPPCEGGGAWCSPRQEKPPFAAASWFQISPLTDSNRRPPPYHGGLEAVLAGMAGHSRSCFPCKSARHQLPVVHGRASACSTSCTCLVPADCCLFSKHTTQFVSILVSSSRSPRRASFPALP
jgi:hypothetical protein